MRFLGIQDSRMMFYLLFSSVMCFASSIGTELLSLPGCPSLCGNLAIPFPFGMTSECYFDDTFHIICNRSFEPPRAFLRLMSAEVAAISLDGKLELLNSSSSEGEILRMVVDWAAGDAACHEAQRYGSRYACRSPHSQCMDSSTGQGHVCRCVPGYQGNPYLAHGCQDIDECAASNPCEDVCENLPGSFKCYCPKGLVGDGKKDGSGCSHTQDRINWSASRVFLPIGIFVIAPILAITYGSQIGTVESKLETDRSKHFEQNGGNVLRRKLSRRNPELQIYPAEIMDSITDFCEEIAIIRCNPGVKFYRGTLPQAAEANTDARVHVVVQTIERVPEDRIRDFVGQLIFLSKPHENLVRVLGCCLEKLETVIVYEHHGDGNTSLFDCIHGSSVLAANFSCKMRMEAAKGVARGLAYFNAHKSWTAFPDGNICSANIMMNITATSYEPKIFYAAGSNLISRAPEVNDLYTDPEPLNKKSDVYSFGVVLVELLTGGKRGGTDLSDSIKKAQTNRLLDAEMEGKGEEVEKAVELANKCLDVIPSNRPTMKEVLDELLGRRQERPGRLSRLFSRSTVR